MEIDKFAWGCLAIGGAYVAVPTEQANSAQSFAQSPDAAIAALMQERRVVNGTGLGSLTVASQGMDGHAVLIGVTRAGDTQSVICRVAVSAASPGQTRAAVDCTEAGAEDEPMRRLGAKAMAIIVREHVAATIEKRPYDIDRVADRVLALIAINRIVIAASMPPPR